jgi:hypothetical protein
MKKYMLATTLCLLAFSENIFAQYASDALRYSQTNFGGSARFQATGGAGTSLGGDISAAYYNPAGLGFNRKSEFSISPSLAIIATDGTMNGTTASDNRTNFNINQFGVSFAFPKDGTSSDWKGGTFAITFTRINNFNNNTIYSGRNDNNSIIDSWIDNTNRYFSVSNLNNQVNNGIYDNEAMAYDTYLINFYQNTSGTGKFDSEVYPGSSLQREKITETGSQNQWNIAYGANYKDFLYIGGGIGIQTINYQRQRVFTETQTTMYPVKDANGNMIPKIFDNLTLTDNLTQNGTGFNLNIGAIVRPVEFWRIGASFTSPTWHSITENYNASLNVNYNGYQIIDNGISKTLNNVKSNTLQLDSDLTITTPLRINTGTSVIIAKKGFLSVDAEYVNYASSKISATFNVDDDNSEIQNNYAATWNFRAGGELRLDKFRLRLGAAHYGTPYKTKDNINQPKIFITGGVGYYSKKNFFDITIVQQTNTVAYQIYKYSNDFVNRIGNPPVAALQTSRTNVVFTAGFFF